MDPLIKSQLLYQLSYAPIENLTAAVGRREAGDLAKAGRPVQPTRAEGESGAAAHFENATKALPFKLIAPSRRPSRARRR